MISVILTIPGKLPSLNEYTRACRAGAYTGARMKRETEDRIGWEIARQVRGRPRLSGVAVAFSWHEPDKRRDPDNVIAGKKWVLDALVRGGVIAGDSWRHVLAITDRWYCDPDAPRVVVTITPTERTTA